MRFFYSSLIIFLTWSTFLSVDAQSIPIDLDVNKLSNEIDSKLSAMQSRGSLERASVLIPWFDNKELNLEVEEASQFEPALQAQYPDIRSFRVSTPDGTRYGRLNTSPRGVFMVLLGGDSPVGILHRNEGPKPTHSLEYIDMEAQYAALACDVENDDKEHEHQDAQRMQANSCFQLGGMLRQYRMALACSGEFAANNGGTLASVNTAYNNRLAELNAIYEVDVAVTFVIIAGNDVLVNLDATTDPFSDPSNSVTSLSEGEAFVESLIIDADYDIGHSVHDVTSGGASGRAGLGVVCVNTAKARGWSTLFNGFNLAIMQHEVGHQFSCQHTNFGCASSGAQRYEVGRGNTIMNPGTITNCTGTNSVNSIAPISNLYFHVGSIVSLENHISSTATCFTSVSTSNGAPSSDASASGGNTIPANTPFKLEGGGSDPDGDALTYCWEQYDTDGVSTGIPTATANSTVAPLFRSNFPSSDPDRYFPKLSTILSGVAPDGTDGELLTNVTRTLTFRLTARDGGSGIACDETTVSVVNTGLPFEITSQNTATSLTANGSNTATVTWDVAGTTANGINTANVDIIFSEDGGMTFGYTIASATSNDGSHTFIVPAFATTNGRIMVKGSGNIFFDINDAPITITVGGSCAAKAIAISPAAAVSANAGDPSLDLSLSPDWGNQLSSPLSLVVDGGDPTSSAFLEDLSTGNCSEINSGNFYQEQQVYAGSNATYTFSATGSSGSFIQCATLFENDYQLSCTDFLGATLKINGNSLSFSPFTATMNTSTSYDLVAFPTNNSATGTVNVSFSGGNLFDGIPDPGAGYFYTYGIINDATGNIVAFDPSADLSNSTTFPAGNYTVFGASVENGTTLTTYEGGTKAAFVNAAAVQTICARVSTNEVAVTISSPPLPVELLSFTGEAQDDGNVLSWESASEFGTDAYQVERLDGDKWNTIGKVPTVGVASVYDFSDAKTAPGSYYYRLAMLEEDGSVDYSTTISILRNAKEEKSLSVYPNPSKSGDFNLQWSKNTQIGLIRIYNAVGQLSLEYNVADPSKTNLQLQTGLPPGTYTLTVTYANRASETARIVVIP